VGIVAFCPQGHRVKVKDQLAGRKGVCPTCGARFRIPLESVAEPAAPLPLARVVPLEAAEIATLPRVLIDEPQPVRRGPAKPGETVGTPPPPSVARHSLLDERPELAWSRAVPGGAASAPMSAAELRAWLDSGAAVGNELVWRSDWEDWRPLGAVFPNAQTTGGHP
jgi:hypothetical protein